MTNVTFPSLLLLTLFFLLSCGSTSVQKTINPSLTTASLGLIKNKNLTFPLYLTDKIEPREMIVSKTADNVFIVHTGHLFKATATKEENEAVLESLKGLGIDVVSLSIEDFIIAAQQDILFEKYPQKFLNSSVIDLNEDTVITKANIVPYIVHEGIALIGLSDKNIDKLLSMDKFLVSDYVVAILRAKKAAVKAHASIPKKPVNSFIVVHTIGEEINEILERLPPNYLDTSLAD